MMRVQRNIVAISRSLARVRDRVLCCHSLLCAWLCVCVTRVMHEEPQRISLRGHNAHD